MTTHNYLIALLAMLFACDPSANETQPQFEDNSDLLAMHDADQADRLGQIDWSSVAPRDSARRERTAEMLNDNLVVTAADYYHAAMIFQHGVFGDTTSARRAFDLMETALALDSTVENGKWLRAAAWDRYLMYKGEPQWYGTQFSRPGADEPWALWEVDTTQVTDADRLANDVPPLAEARARAENMNR